MAQRETGEPSQVEKAPTPTETKLAAVTEDITAQLVTDAPATDGQVSEPEKAQAQIPVQSVTEAPPTAEAQAADTSGQTNAQDDATGCLTASETSEQTQAQNPARIATPGEETLAPENEVLALEEDADLQSVAPALAGQDAAAVRGPVEASFSAATSAPAEPRPVQAPSAAPSQPKKAAAGGKAPGAANTDQSKTQGPAQAGSPGIEAAQAKAPQVQPGADPRAGLFQAVLSETAATPTQTSDGAPLSTGLASSQTQTAVLTMKAQMQGPRPNLPVQDLAVQIARQFEAGASRFKIRLDPPELGRVDVRLEIGDDGIVRAHMSADRPETLDLLQRDAKALERALQNLGLNRDGEMLDFSLRQDGGKGRGTAGADPDGQSQDGDGANDHQNTADMSRAGIISDLRVDIVI